MLHYSAQEDDALFTSAFYNGLDSTPSPEGDDMRDEVPDEDDFESDEGDEDLDNGYEDDDFEEDELDELFDEPELDPHEANLTGDIYDYLYH